MKVAIMPEAGKIEMKDLPVPEMHEDEVLVKVKAVGVCTWEQGFFFGMASGFPFAGGHEICGIVEKVGSKVGQDVKPGDKVVVASLTRCGECYYCRRGYDNQCANAVNSQKLEGYEGPAGFAEYFVAKGYEIYKVVQDTPFERGILAEPLACVTHSLDVSNIKSGDYALVCGAGIMGVLHVMLAKLRGAKVIISEPDELRRKKALEFGADYVINPFEENVKDKVLEITNNIGVEECFYTAGGRASIEAGIDSLAIRGTLVVYGKTGKNDVIAFDPKVLHYKEFNLTGVTKHTKDSFRVASELLSNKSLPLDKLVEVKYDFDNIVDAFEAARERSSYRVVLTL